MTGQTKDIQRRALDLFEQSLEVERGERSAWLREKTGSDAALRDAIARLVGADKRFDGFLETQPASSSELRVGSTIGRWQVRRVLAQGGMGMVFLVERADGAYQQLAALKLIRGFLLSPPEKVLQQLNRRFEAERRILARITHDGVARILDGGTSDDGMPYLVMEYVEGLPLTTYCQEHQLPIRDRLALVRQLLLALGVVHRNLIVHRDLKPSNILVTGSGQVKLLDFGIAKVLQEQPDTAPEATLTQVLAFTPDYASPEQAQGEAVTTASDVYSVGLLLYELVTDGKAYAVPAGPPGKAAKFITEVKLLPPSRVAVSPVAPEVDLIIMKALHKDPEERYGSAAEMAADIERWLEGLPVRAHAGGAGYRIRKFVSRHRIPVATAAVVFMTLAVSLGATFWQFRQAAGAAARADASNAFLVEVLSSATPYSEDHAVTLLDAVNLAEQKVAKRFSNQPRLEADVRQAIGMAYQSLGRVEEGAVQLDRALSLRRTAGTSFDQAESTHGLGLIAWWRADYRESERLFRQSLELIRGESSSAASALRGQILNDLGALQVEAGDAVQGLATLEQVRASPDIYGPMSEADKQSYLSNLASALGEVGRQDEAGELLAEVIAMTEASRQQSDPNYPVYLNNYGNWLIVNGQPAAAAPRFEQAIQLHQQNLGQTELTVIPLINLSRSRRFAGDFDGAVAAARDAFQTAQATMSPGNPMLGRALVIQALAEESAGLLDDALANLEQARLAYEQVDILRPDLLGELDVAYARISQLRSASASPP